MEDNRITLSSDDKKFYVIANWKLNQPIDNIQKWYEKFSSWMKNATYKKDIEIIVCPSFLSLETLCKNKENNMFEIGAQDLSLHTRGSFTGEVSGNDLCVIGVKYVILGHSERRIYYNETDDKVLKKIQIALNNDITPIVCVGEQEDSFNTKFVCNQIDYYLSNIDKEDIKKIIFTYEPVFSIGKNNIVDVDDINRIIRLIREMIYLYLGSESKSVTLQYGGSISSDNIIELIKKSDIDGLLIGRSGIDVYEFIRILELICKI